MSANVDVLIHRYLEGALDGEGAAVLEEALRRDPAVRRRLAEMAFDRLELRDLVRSDATAAPARRARPAWAVPLAAAAIMLAAVGAALLLARPSPPPAAPAAAPVGKEAGDYRGYAGPLRLRVLVPAEGSARMEVVEVPGAPGHPLVGQKVVVAAGFTRGDAGTVGGPNKVHQAFLRRLEPGAEVVLDVRHAGEDLFLVGQLTRTQAAWAVPLEGDRPREKRKDPVRKDREGETKEDER